MVRAVDRKSWHWHSYILRYTFSLGLVFLVWLPLGVENGQGDQDSSASRYGTKERGLLCSTSSLPFYSANGTRLPHGTSWSVTGSSSVVFPSLWPGSRRYLSAVFGHEFRDCFSWIQHF